jgi:hypothetical protein
MTTGEAEFDTEGVGPLAFADKPTGTLVRRLGAFERLCHPRQQSSCDPNYVCRSK